MVTERLLLSENWLSPYLNGHFPWRINRKGPISAATKLLQKFWFAFRPALEELEYEKTVRQTPLLTHRSASTDYAVRLGKNERSKTRASAW